MRNYLFKFTKLTLCFLLFTYFSSNSTFAQLGDDYDWDWNEDSIDWNVYYQGWDGDNELPCDSLLQFECNGETIEFAACEIDWNLLADCFWDNYDYDWDDYNWGWNEDSIDWNVYYQGWDGDNELPCDSLIQFECNGETIEFAACEIDWNILIDCFETNYDYDYEEEWNGYEDSIDWNVYYQGWDGDNELPCDSLIQFECNGEIIEFAACEIDWNILIDCFETNYDYDYEEEWNGYEDSIDWNVYYQGWDGDNELPCDSLIQFECNGETIEFAACEIDWNILFDCFETNEADVNDDNEEDDDVNDGEEGDLIFEQTELFQAKNDKANIYNPVISQVYPNPVINDLNVVFTSAEPTSVDFIITDIKGSIVYEEEGVDLLGGGKYTHPISFDTKLPMGMYKLNVINVNKQIIETQNLIISK